MTTIDGRPTWRTLDGGSLAAKMNVEPRRKEVMKLRTRTLAIAAAFTALLAAPVRAEDVKAGDLVISQAWSRQTPTGAKVAGAYLTVENKGSAADKLIGGSGDVAGRVEIHEMAMDGSVMRMRPLDQGLVIEPGKTVKLAPGGNHMMLLDLKTQLKQGDKVPVTLQFEKAGKVNVSLDVQGVGAQAPGGGGDSGHMMKK
jgi:periplasmic copper chaperone A